MSTEVVKPVDVMRLIRPKFITLAGAPANQTGFKVLREDANDTEEAVPAKPHRIKRSRAVQRTSLLCIYFPVGTSDEEIHALATEYGLSGYAVVEEADGSKCLKRSDTKDIPEDALTVHIEKGRRVMIARSTQLPTLVVPVEEPKPHIGVAGLVFTKDKYPDPESVIEFLSRNDIDFIAERVDNTEDGTVVMRSEVPEGTEVRKIEVSPGVVALVVRSSESDQIALMPASDCGMDCCISDVAYGRWGWGQIDFNASMADVQFCDAAEKAIERLESVTSDILFYSSLPVTVRKELITRACSQYALYVVSLLDALPMSVVTVARSSRERKEQQTMTVEKQEVASGDKADVQSEEKPITRAEVEALVAAAVAAAMPAPTTKVETTVTEEPHATSDVAGGLSEVVASLDKLLSPVADTLASIVSRMDKMESATVVRSDSVDNATREPSTDNNPFKGIFGLR